MINIEKRVKQAINKLNTDAFIYSGTEKYFDGDAAYVIIKQAVDDIVTDCVGDVAGTDAIKEIVADVENPHDIKKHPGRPKKSGE